MAGEAANEAVTGTPQCNAAFTHSSVAALLFLRKG